MSDDDLAAVYRQIRKTRNGLRAIPADLEQQERAINADEDLTAEARRIKLRQVREGLRAKQRRLHDELVKVCKRADRLAAEAANEGGTRQAHTRVRQLFSDNVSTDSIIKRAEGIGDADTIRAVRAEVLYLGGEDGFVDAAETVEACNRALGRLGSTGAELLVEIDKARKPIGAIDAFAAKKVDGTATPHDRLTLAYALGDQEGDDA